MRAEELAYAVLVNQSAVHALPAMLSVVHSAVLGWMTDSPAARIVPTNAPYPTLASETPAATLESAGRVHERGGARVHNSPTRDRCSYLVLVPVQLCSLSFCASR